MSTFPFKFGINGLDQLIDSDSTDDDIWSMAIVGPDGCGKSILAMSTASTYLNTTPKGIVVYFSTDLSHSKAQRQWESFQLNNPSVRDKELSLRYGFERTVKKNRKLELNGVRPTNLSKDSFKQNHVLFVDLKTETAGDDWHFCNELVSLIQTNNNSKPLVILDAVEGLEAVSGDSDLYGELRNRRSRIAQFLRNTQRCGCHVLLVVEEPHGDYYLPEQYVVDAVVRLRKQKQGIFFQRTIEVEKFRSFSHAIGEHELLIRDGKGTKTGDYPHVDDPCVGFPHVHVIHSLHKRNSDQRASEQKLSFASGDLEFVGLRMLNDIVSANRSAKTVASSGPSIGILLGNPGANKSLLAEHFAANAFFDARREVRGPMGVAIFLTTRFADRDDIFESILKKSGGQVTEKARSEIADHLFCRRFNARHMSAAEFMDILTAYIRSAQRILSLNQFNSENVDANTRREISKSIFLVIEDWSQMISTYTGLRDDPMLQQTMINYLKREGVSTLLVSSVQGPPGLVGNEFANHDLRNLDETQIIVWNVPFFGEQSTAVTVFASNNPFAKGSGNRPAILNLNVVPDGGRVEISREFSLYSDVEVGRPSRVVLNVRLYSGNHHKVMSGSGIKYQENLQNALEQLAPSPSGSERLLEFHSYEDYDRLFTLADSLNKSKIDSTLVIQVDEFWGERRDCVLLNLNEYWFHNTQLASKSVSKVFQPYSLDDTDSKQASPDSSAIPEITARNSYHCDEISRSSFFIDPKDSGIGNLGDVTKDGKSKPAIHRIPFTWDFGLILTRRSLWFEHRLEDTKNDEYAHKKSEGNGRNLKIGDIWNSLCISDSVFGDSELSYKGRILWTEFLSACQHLSDKSNVSAFGVDCSTDQSLLCLVLEIWMSFEQRFKNAHSGYRSTFVEPVISNPQSTSFREMLDGGSVSLFLALSTVFTACNLTVGNDEKCVASREWYHTSSAKMKAADLEKSQNDYEVLTLPGGFTTRGDWHLGIANGSRSPLLGEQALDLLSNRRLSLVRMQEGIGLPVRDFRPDTVAGITPTALSTFDAKNGDRRPVKYGEVCSLGAASESNDLMWLMRSRIGGFDRCSFYFAGWLRNLYSTRNSWLPQRTLLNKLMERVFTTRNVANQKDLEQEIRMNDDCQDYFAKFCKEFQALRLSIRG